ncbi:hypothetical protein CPB86DRAFT_799501 [Serendipita vermifera]|nr:hypothetical protein CPB86DRAFT_799501 [Serendipita vermifera]
MSAKFLQASFKFIPNWQRSAEEQDLHDDLRWIVRNGLKQHKRCVISCKELEEAYRKTILNFWSKISPNLSSFQKKIEEATWKDRRDLEGRFSNHTTQMNPSPQRIEISFMNSDQPAVTIEGQFSKYAQIRLQLLKDGHIDPGGGHIWVRRSRTRRLLPPSGYYWEHASANSDIEAEAGTLHVQFVDVTYRNEYIVAILHNGTEREFPEALEYGHNDLLPEPAD